MERDEKMKIMMIMMMRRQIGDQQSTVQRNKFNFMAHSDASAWRKCRDDGTQNRDAHKNIWKCYRLRGMTFFLFVASRMRRKTAKRFHWITRCAVCVCCACGPLSLFLDRVFAISPPLRCLFAAHEFCLQFGWVGHIAMVMAITLSTISPKTKKNVNAPWRIPFVLICVPSPIRLMTELSIASRCLFTHFHSTQITRNVLSSV